MNLKMDPVYEQLIKKANRSHENNRSPAEIDQHDVCRARLYCYAFRAQTIGTFHATRLAIQGRPSAGALSSAYRDRAVETLDDLADQAMDAVPADFRAVISTLYRYHRGVLRVIQCIERDCQESQDTEIGTIGRRFCEIIEQITTSCGIALTQDTEAPPQASFVVPNLGIIIAPLVYGDYHSWGLAFLAGEAHDVPTHRHQHGVEIHLGFNPTHGVTVLEGCRASVEEGYAMPIPPMTDHGWVNTGDAIHHVPFIFGSLVHGGWGVFLDVEPQPRPIEELSLVERDSPPFHQMVYLEREISRAETEMSSRRSTLIPHTVTDRAGSGGLELSVTRVAEDGFTFPTDDFRIVSVVRGSGVVSIDSVECSIRAHDHFGIPCGMTATLKQKGSAPLVVLDVLIKSR